VNLYVYPSRVTTGDEYVHPPSIWSNQGVWNPLNTLHWRQTYLIMVKAKVVEKGPGTTLTIGLGHAEKPPDGENYRFDLGYL